MPFPTLADEIKQMREQTPKPKVLIESVEFEGATALPTNTLEELVTALKQRTFDANSEWLNEIHEMVRGVWQDRGYFQAMITPTPRLVGGDTLNKRAALTIRVEEGNQYRLREIKIRRALIELNDIKKTIAFPPEELRKLIPLEDGEIFNVAKIRQGLDALRKLYASKGYIDFTAMPLTDVEADRQVIGLVLELDEQKQFRYGKIEALGLDPKIEAVLKSRLKPGDVFNNDVIEGFFREFKWVLPAGASTANVDLRRDINKGTVDFLLDLRPCPQPVH